MIVTDADSQTAQIRNLRNEDGKVVRNGGVTITTSVQACVVATKEKLLVKDKYDEQVIASDPCWPYVECASGSGGRRLDDDRRHLAYAPIQVPAGFPAHQMFDPAQPASPDNLPCHTPNTVFERHKKVYFSEDDVMQVEQRPSQGPRKAAAATAAAAASAALLTVPAPLPRLPSGATTSSSCAQTTS